MNLDFTTDQPINLIDWATKQRRGIDKRTQQDIQNCYEGAAESYKSLEKLLPLLERLASEGIYPEDSQSYWGDLTLSCVTLENVQRLRPLLGRVEEVCVYLASYYSVYRHPEYVKGQDWVTVTLRLVDHEGVYLQYHRPYEDTGRCKIVEQTSPSRKTLVCNAT